jgi:hypothetical protein
MEQKYFVHVIGVNALGYTGAPGASSRYAVRLSEDWAFIGSSTLGSYNYAGYPTDRVGLPSTYGVVVGGLIGIPYFNGHMFRAGQVINLGGAAASLTVLTRSDIRPDCVVVPLLVASYTGTTVLDKNLQQSGSLIATVKCTLSWNQPPVGYPPIPGPTPPTTIYFPGKPGVSLTLPQNGCTWDEMIAFGGSINPVYNS